MLISIIVDVLQFNKNSMKNPKGLLAIASVFSLLMLTSCNDNKVPKVTSFVPSSSSEQVTDDKPQANPGYEEYKGFKWYVPSKDDKKPPKKFELFNDPKIIPEWISLRSSTSNNPKELLQVQLNLIDLLMAKSEGNAGYVESIDSFLASKASIFSEDPGFSGSGNGSGLANAGFASVNCYANRPIDTIMREVCTTLFKEIGSSMDEFVKLDEDGKTELFYKMKLGVYLGNMYQSILRKNASSMMQKLQSEGLGNTSTTVKLVFIDQSNQLGLGGATKLLRLYNSLLGTPKKELLTKLNNIGFGSNQGVFVTGYGESINLNELPDDLLRLTYARIKWHNGSGTESNFNSTDKWLYRAAKRWTFGAYSRVNVDVKKQLIQEVGSTDGRDLEFRAVKTDGDKLEVTVLKNDQTVLTKTYDYQSTKIYKGVDVAGGDILRRIGTFAISQEQFNKMEPASRKFFKNYYYQSYGLKK
jgi:hypothetical protein